MSGCLLLVESWRAGLKGPTVHLMMGGCFLQGVKEEFRRFSGEKLGVYPHAAE